MYYYRVEGGGGGEPRSGELSLCKLKEKTAKWHHLVLFSAPHNTQNS